MPGQGHGTSADDLPGRLAALAEPVAAEQGIELVDVEVKGPRNRRVVRLVADAEGGLDIDRIAELSRAVGDAIDDVVDGCLHPRGDLARHGPAPATPAGLRPQRRP